MCRICYKTWIWSICCCCLLVGCSLSSAPVSTPTQAVQATQVAQATPGGRPFHQIIQTLDGAFTVTLDIAPNRSGSNVFTALVLDNHTKQPAATITVTLYTTMQDMAMGTSSIVLQAGGNGQFSATGNNLNMNGDWAIGIAIQTSDHALHKAGVSLVVSL